MMNKTKTRKYIIGAINMFNNLLNDPTATVFLFCYRLVTTKGQKLVSMQS